MSPTTADTHAKPRSRLKLGCFCVLGLCVLLGVWAASLFGTALTRARNEVIENRELSHEISRTPGPTSEARSRPAAGRVVLDFTVGDFRVVAGEPGEPIAVTAEFDTRSYELRERHEIAAGSIWTYSLTFDETTWFKDGGLRALLGGSFPTITVSLPPDVPLELVGRFGKGHADVNLGGLWLTDVDLRFEKGALELDVDRPLVVPLERLTIRSRQGGTFVQSLGNASPRTLEIDHRMGGLSVDLCGQWVRDADIRIVSRMGGAELRLPDDVEIRGLPTERPRLAPAYRPELPRPTLNMSVSSRLGGMSVVEPLR